MTERQYLSIRFIDILDFKLWASKMSDLYDNFLSTIKPEDYYNYLKKLRDSSRNYMLVVSPTDNMFQGHSISKKILQG